jgi:hypothetical protein
MSGRNGDKARFNNYRRRKLAKRQRVRSFFAALQTRPKPAAPAVVARAEPAKRPAARPAVVAAKPAPAAKAEKKPRTKTAARQ